MMRVAKKKKPYECWKAAGQVIRQSGQRQRKKPRAANGHRGP